MSLSVSLSVWKDHIMPHIPLETFPEEVLQKNDEGSCNESYRLAQLFWCGRQLWCTNKAWHAQGKAIKASICMTFSPTYNANCKIEDNWIYSAFKIYIKCNMTNYQLYDSWILHNATKSDVHSPVLFNFMLHINHKHNLGLLRVQETRRGCIDNGPQIPLHTQFNKLCWSGETRDIDTFELLLKADSNPIEAVNLRYRRNISPLQYLVGNLYISHVYRIATLLIKYGADVNETYEDGKFLLEHITDEYINTQILGWNSVKPSDVLNMLALFLENGAVIPEQLRKKVEDFRNLKGSKLYEVFEPYLNT